MKSNTVMSEANPAYRDLMMSEDVTAKLEVNPWKQYVQNVSKRKFVCTATAMTTSRSRKDMRDNFR